VWTGFKQTDGDLAEEGKQRNLLTAAFRIHLKFMQGTEHLLYFLPSLVMGKIIPFEI